MHVSDQGVRLLQVFEHCRLTPYIDSGGVYTIGWGHALIGQNGRQVTRQADVAWAMNRLFGYQNCTQDQADRCLRADLARFESAVTADCPAATLSQFDAMVSFAYNAGAGNFHSSSVRRLHNAGHTSFPDVSLQLLASQGKAGSLVHPTDIGQAFAAWARDNGQWVLGLFRRRMCEAMVYRGGDVDQAFQRVEAFRA